MEGVQVKTEPFEEIFIPAVKLEPKEEQQDLPPPLAVRRKQIRRRKNLQCDECKIKYVDPEMLAWHRENCHGPNAIITVIKTKYQCNSCQTMFKDVYNLLRHLRFQHKLIKLPFQCHSCDKSFVVMKNLKKHRGLCKNIRINSSVRTEKCEQCSASFVHTEMLTWHMENFHSDHPTLKLVTGEKKFQCLYCKLKFKEVRYAVSHLWSQHELVKLPYQCKYCKKYFISYRNITKHARCKKCKPTVEQTEVSLISDKSHNDEQQEILTSKIDIEERPIKHEPVDCPPFGEKYLTKNPSVKKQQAICQEYKPEPQQLEMLTSKIDIEEHPIKLEPEELEYPPSDVKPRLELEECRVLVAKLLECDSCCFYTNNKTRLATHMQAHHPTADVSGMYPKVRLKKTLKCGECGIRYGFHRMLTWHMEFCHGSEAIVKIYTTNKQCTFQCMFCPSEYKRSEDIIHHLHNQHRVCNLPFSCQFCGKPFSRVHSMKNHQLICPSLGQVNVPVSNGVKCKLCDEQFDSAEQVNEHVQNFHGITISQQQWECLYCDETFRFCFPLFSHCRNEHPGQQVLQCCGTWYKSYSPYDLHKKYKHATSYYSCNICSSKLSTPHYLAQHMATVHSQETWACNLCNATFKCKPYLSFHIQSIHTGTILKCSKCNFETRVQSRLDSHHRSKHSKFNGKCQFCDAKFNNMTNLRRHVLWKHTGPFLDCQFCEYRTRRKCLLKQHIRTKHLLPQQSFQCQICNATFRCKSYLNQHVRNMHTGQILHCEHCNFSTRGRGILIAHIKRNHLQTNHIKVLKPVFTYSKVIKSVRRRHRRGNAEIK